MYNDLKNEIKDIIDIVNQCPDSLQEKCFELLLNNYLLCLDKVSKAPKESVALTQSEDTLGNEQFNDYQVPDNDEEILLTDFHVKIQRLLQGNGIDASIINQLYYKEDGKMLPLYDTLGSTKMSECQIRLSLLTAFENAYNNGNGELTFNGEVVRSRCQEMKCYDAPNFATNFKSHSKYFDNWSEKYDKNTEYNLSVEGKRLLSETLKVLSKGQG